MSLTIVHQYAPALAASLIPGLPDTVDFVALGESTETAWAVPPNADVLLISQNSAAVGMAPDMPRPAGWPFNLKWVHLRSTGIDKYPDWIYEAPLLTVTRGGYATPIAEYVLAAMLSFAKHIPEIWTASRADWHSHKLGGLAGQTVGIVGFGAIGKAIAQRALAFEMTVLGTRRSGSESGVDGVTIASLEHVLALSDHVVLCAPLTDATRGMIDAAAFSGMREGAHLVNIGRGALIDTDALRHALEGTLGGATLDVTHPEPPPEGHWLFNHPKVRLSPHVSGSSPHTEATVNDLFVANLDRYLAGEALEGVVDRTAGY